MTEYDEEYAITHVRMCSMRKDCTDWREVTQIVLRIDVELGPDRARRTFDTYLARAEMDGAHGIPTSVEAGQVACVS